MNFFTELKRAPVGDHTSRDLLNELHNYFTLPMPMQDKILAAFIVTGLLTLTGYITYRAIRLIWKGEERKKLL